mmetsp:Transcript_25749/g.56483  ORF Transcript_25749/g.56483 Transcript_25749/m.56483 type:complete len:115 (+) Transcript_25749:1702-2046(+)
MSKFSKSRARFADTDWIGVGVENPSLVKEDESAGNSSGSFSDVDAEPFSTASTAEKSFAYLGEFPTSSEEGTNDETRPALLLIATSAYNNSEPDLMMINIVALHRSNLVLIEFE